MRQGVVQLLSGALNHMWTKHLHDNCSALTVQSQQEPPRSATGGLRAQPDQVHSAQAEAIVQRMAGLVGRLEEGDRELLLAMAEKLLNEQRQAALEEFSRREEQLYLHHPAICRQF